MTAPFTLIVTSPVPSVIVTVKELFSPNVISSLKSRPIFITLNVVVLVIPKAVTSTVFKPGVKSFAERTWVNNPRELVLPIKLLFTLTTTSVSLNEGNNLITTLLSLPTNTSLASSITKSGPLFSIMWLLLDLKLTAPFPFLPLLVK